MLVLKVPGFIPTFYRWRHIALMSYRHYILYNTKKSIRVLNTPLYFCETDVIYFRLNISTLVALNSGTLVALNSGILVALNSGIFIYPYD